MDHNTIVEIKGLTKQYDTLIAVNNLDLEIKDGQIFGLLGPNGSGKSTIINCILSLIRFEEGSIRIFGKTMIENENEKEIKKNIGVILQDVAVFDELTVYENIEYFCSLYVKGKDTVRHLTEEAIAFVALEDFKDYYPDKLSGGLLRRLNIACGIAHKPRLVILDEPTVAVDPQSRNRILEGILNLNKQGATIIYTTHYMEEVEQICDQIAIIDKGEVVALGTKESLKDSVHLSETIIVEANGIKDSDIDELNETNDYTLVEYHDNILKVKSKKENEGLIRLLNFFKQKNIMLTRIQFETPTLNDVFLEITGKELRD